MTTTVLQNYSYHRRFDEIEGSERTSSVGMVRLITSMQLQSVNEASILRLPMVTFGFDSVTVSIQGCDPCGESSILSRSPFIFKEELK